MFHNCYRLITVARAQFTAEQLIVLIVRSISIRLLYGLDVHFVHEDLIPLFHHLTFGKEYSIAYKQVCNRTQINVRVLEYTYITWTNCNLCFIITPIKTVLLLGNVAFRILWSSKSHGELICFKVMDLMLWSIKSHSLKQVSIFLKHKLE